MYTVGNKEPKNNRNTIRNNETEKKGGDIFAVPEHYPYQ